jgi:3-dehydroquinate synthase
LSSVDLQRVNGSGQTGISSAIVPGVMEMLSRNTIPSTEAAAVDLRHGLVERSQTVAAGAARYDVQMTAGSLEACSEILRQTIGNAKALIVTTPTVERLYARDVFQFLQAGNNAVQMMILECSEAQKTVDQVTCVCKEAMEFGIGRRDLLIGVGGGVCTDITTVAASWIRRGIEYVRVPTTLIGQIDAGIGIKGAVNFQRKKSYLGCFFPPRAVVVTPSLLSTLPRRHLREGIAEMIKIAIVRDRSLFAAVESWGGTLASDVFGLGHSQRNDLLWQSIAGMLAELEPNIFENQTYERLVDFGHTFSPALESASNFAITHGEAVSIDMAISVALARAMKMLDEDAALRILKALTETELPIWTDQLTSALCMRALADCALHRGGRPNLVVPIDVGEATFLVDEAAIAARLPDALDWLLEVNSHTAGASIPRCEQPKFDITVAD